MNTKLLNSLQLKGFLSFSLDSEPVELTGLNLLIGPNGVGKSNFIEALELLHATPLDFSEAIRLGGLPNDWVWHGKKKAKAARIDALLTCVDRTPELRYAIEFADSGGRLEIIDEVLEEAAKADPNANDVRFFYRYQGGNPTINTVVQVEDEATQRTYNTRTLKRQTIDPQQSILYQKKRHRTISRSHDCRSAFQGHPDFQRVELREVSSPPDATVGESADGCSASAACQSGTGSESTGARGLVEPVQ